MLPGYHPDQVDGTWEPHAQGSIDACETGLFKPFKDLIDPVAKGESVGVTHHPDMLWKTPEGVTALFGGLVLAKRPPGEVRRGDAMYQVARDAVPR